MEIGDGFHLFALEASNYPLIAHAAMRRCPERHRARKMQILPILVYLFFHTHTQARTFRRKRHHAPLSQQHDFRARQ